MASAWVVEAFDVVEDGAAGLVVAEEASGEDRFDPRV